MSIAPENAETDLTALEAFEVGPWSQKYPAISQSWRRRWEQVIPFYAFSAPIRRIIYTTNQIEALNSKLRRAIRNRGHFPGDEAAMELLYLVLNHAAEEWKRPPRAEFLTCVDVYGPRPIATAGWIRIDGHNC